MSVNKVCTHCKLVVYPLEQLKCLDQIWHRKCFRCNSCGMVLTMGNYRGYEKKPYCSAHYPQPKRFTVVADTPELQRVAQNTRVLSNANYSRRIYQPAGTNQHNRSSVDGSASTHHTTAESNGHDSNAIRFNRWSSSDSAPMSDQPEKSDRSHISRSPHYSNGHRMYGTETCYSLASATTSHESISSYNAQFGSYPSRHNYCFPSESAETETATNATTKADAVLQKYRALYDYEAREDDEVTFIEGDIILDGDPITDGWMYGTVQRTGQFGMLPSNYVEPI